MPYSFWGSAVQPQATPSETCLPHQLRITKAVLDPVQAAKLKPGTRVSIWATQKMRPQRRGVLQPVESKRTLVAILVSSQRESVDTRLNFRNSTLLSFSVSPKSHACAVHLTGYFDHRADTKPEAVDDGSITWAELQELLANARGGEDSDEAKEALEQQIAQSAKCAGSEHSEEEPAAKRRKKSSSR